MASYRGQSKHQEFSLDQVLQTCLHRLGKIELFQSYKDYLNSEWLVEIADIEQAIADGAAWSDLKLPSKLKLEIKDEIGRLREQQSTSKQQQQQSIQQLLQPPSVIEPRMSSAQSVVSDISNDDLPKRPRRKATSTTSSGGSLHSGDGKPRSSSRIKHSTKATASTVIAPSPPTTKNTLIWSRSFSAAHNCYFYYNHITRTSQWEEPPDYSHSEPNLTTETLKSRQETPIDLKDDHHDQEREEHHKSRSKSASHRQRSSSSSHHHRHSQSHSHSQQVPVSNDPIIQSSHSSPQEKHRSSSTNRASRTSQRAHGASGEINSQLSSPKNSKIRPSSVPTVIPQTPPSATRPSDSAHAVLESKSLPVSPSSGASLTIEIPSHLPPSRGGGSKKTDPNTSNISQSQIPPLPSNHRESSHSHSHKPHSISERRDRSSSSLSNDTHQSNSSDKHSSTGHTPRTNQSLDATETGIEPATAAERRIDEGRESRRHKTQSSDRSSMPPETQTKERSKSRHHHHHSSSHHHSMTPASPPSQGIAMSDPSLLLPSSSSFSNSQQHQQPHQPHHKHRSKHRDSSNPPSFASHSSEANQSLPQCANNQLNQTAAAAMLQPPVPSLPPSNSNQALSLYPVTTGLQNSSISSFDSTSSINLPPETPLVSKPSVTTATATAMLPSASLSSIQQPIQPFSPATSNSASSSGSTVGGSAVARLLGLTINVSADTNEEDITVPPPDSSLPSAPDITPNTRKQFFAGELSSATPHSVSQMSAIPVTPTESNAIPGFEPYRSKTSSPQTTIPSSSNNSRAPTPTVGNTSSSSSAFSTVDVVSALNGTESIRRNLMPSAQPNFPSVINGPSYGMSSTVTPYVVPAIVQSQVSLIPPLDDGDMSQDTEVSVVPVIMNPSSEATASIPSAMGYPVMSFVGVPSSNRRNSLDAANRSSASTGPTPYAGPALISNDGPPPPSNVNSTFRPLPSTTLASLALGGGGSGSQSTASSPVVPGAANQITSNSFSYPSVSPNLPAAIPPPPAPLSFGNLSFSDSSINVESLYPDSASRALNPSQNAAAAAAAAAGSSGASGFSAAMETLSGGGGGGGGGRPRASSSVGTMSESLKSSSESTLNIRPTSVLFGNTRRRTTTSDINPSTRGDSTTTNAYSAANSIAGFAVPPAATSTATSSEQITDTASAGVAAAAAAGGGAAAAPPSGILPPPTLSRSGPFNIPPPNTTASSSASGLLSNLRLNLFGSNKNYVKINTKRSVS